MATKKSKSSGMQPRHLISILFLALGIYLVVAGVLSIASDNWRGIMIATGLAFAAGSTIAISKH